MLDILPDSLLLSVFGYLQPEDISRVGRCCSKLRRVSKDNILWRNIFHTYFNILPNIFPEPIGSDSWREEFIRLVNETPDVETEVITKHTDQVLHVSFSHDGNRFATCSKDAKVHVWMSSHPVQLEYSYNMEVFHWKYTQYSQFNESDSLLLVSGVLFGLNSTSGEIAVFSLTDGFSLKCRVPSKPYDIFGTWYSDNFLLSGNLHWLGHLVSKSVIWLNKASQEVHSEHAAISNKMFQFYNPKASSIRSVMIANCVQQPNIDDLEVDPSQSGRRVLENNRIAAGIDIGLSQTSSKGEKSSTLQGSFQNWRPLDNVTDTGYTQEYHVTGDKVNSSQSASSSAQDPGPSTKNTRKQTFDDSDNSGTTLQEEKRPKFALSNLSESDNNKEHSVSDNSMAQNTESDSSILLDSRDKWLIFTCGSQTYSPHQVGFKKIKPVYFQSRIDPGPSIKERRAELRRRRMMEQAGEEVEASVDYTNYPLVAALFDQSDVVLDLHGHIIGMALSPDHRYLYVNSRPWPTGYTISDPLEPPPIAQEIDIHVIDLATLTQVAMMSRGHHKAFTPNEECFFIFLDAADLYLASGSEDKHCYLWDRHYGVSISKLAHTDVVNAVAFNPRDSRMLVSVSDDRTIKVWRSKDQCRELNIDDSNLNHGIKLYDKHHLNNGTKIHDKRRASCPPSTV